MVIILCKVNNTSTPAITKYCFYLFPFFVWVVWRLGGCFAAVRSFWLQHRFVLWKGAACQIFRAKRSLKINGPMRAATQLHFLYWSQMLWWEHINDTMHPLEKFVSLELLRTVKIIHYSFNSRVVFLLRAFLSKESPLKRPVLSGIGMQLLS